MPSGGLNTDDMAPRSLILPVVGSPSGAATLSYPTSGAILMSGANLVWYTGSAWNMVSGSQIMAVS